MTAMYGAKLKSEAVYKNNKSHQIERRLHWTKTISLLICKGFEWKEKLFEKRSWATNVSFSVLFLSRWQVGRSALTSGRRFNGHSDECSNSITRQALKHLVVH